MPKTALITGITGQDGSYLAELLLEKGYCVHGLVRRASQFNTSRIDGIYQDRHVAREGEGLHLHYGDMTDGLSLMRVLELASPDEIYNLAAQSHVQVSFETPEYTANVDALGSVRLLELVRTTPALRNTRIYQASTSELFGDTNDVPLSENSPMRPNSPYAAAKLYAYWMTRQYRTAYDLFCSNGILFNHESPRRGPTFVTQKIVRAAVGLMLGNRAPIYLGNLDSLRDWGHAKDYVEAMWKVLQHGEPDDFVIATGVQTSVRQFVEKVFLLLGIQIEWRGTGASEYGVVAGLESTAFGGYISPKVEMGESIVEVDPKYFRPLEVSNLLGDSTKARNLLDWKPQRSLEMLIEDMVSAELVRRGN